jgi:RNA polymerase sigma-70 factor (ECF subfamily)
MTDNDTDQRAHVDNLVVAARTDREAFGWLYEAYYDRIFGYCLRRLISRAAAEDVVSDAFLFVARNMRTFRGTTNEDFRRWLYRIATTEINAFVRRTRRRAKLWNNVVDHRATSRKTATDCAAAADELATSSVHAAIARLTPREQSLVTLRLFENLPHEEIARMLDIREGAARVAYGRALQKLRAILGADADRPPAPARPRG